MKPDVTINLLSVTCIACVRPLETALNEKSEELGLKSFHVDLTSPDKPLYVNFAQRKPQSLQKLLKTIGDCGIDFELLEDHPATASQQTVTQSVETPETSKNPTPDSFFQKLKRRISAHWILAAIGLLTGVTLLALSLTGVALPFAAVVGLTATATALNLIIGAPSFYHAWKKWYYQRSLTMDTLFALSGTVVIGVSIASLFIPGLPMLLEAGLLIFGFRHLGQAIEEQLVHRSTGDTRFLDRLPKKTSKIKEGKKVSTLIEALLPGDIIEIQPGALIPCDAVLLSKQAKIEDTLISGSIIPKTLHENANLLSGMRLAKANADAVRLRVTTAANASYLAKLDAQLITAQRKKAPIQEFTNTLLQYFIPAILIIALLSGIGIAIVFPPAIAIKCAAAVLVSACPCTLGLIIPLVMNVAIKKAMGNGVFFKSPAAVQAASKIDTIVFDLNGSLTQGTPKVTRFERMDSSVNDVYCKSIVAAMEAGNQHPVARALSVYCSKDCANIRPEMQKNQIPGGLCARIQTGSEWQTWVLGNARCMADQGIAIPRFAKTHALPGEQRLFLACGQTLVAGFSVCDPLRAHAKNTVDQLQQQGYAVYICTGADQQTARGYARALGIPESHVKADCVPDENSQNRTTKTTVIKDLQKKGAKVAMVGDAGNDSIALAQSDLGMAMHSAASDSMTQKNAKVLITEQTCLPILHCFTIARQAMRNIKQNLLLSLLYNTGTLVLTGGLLVAIGFSINPALGAGLMVLQTALILLNVYRFARKGIAYRALAREVEMPQKGTFARLGAGVQLQNQDAPSPDLGAALSPATLGESQPLEEQPVSRATPNTLIPNPSPSREKGVHCAN